MCEGARVASSHTRSGVTPPARPTTTRGTGPGKFFKDFFFLVLFLGLSGGGEILSNLTVNVGVPGPG